jgi:hypothetical protein
VGILALHGSNEDVLKPTHATTHGKFVLNEWIIERLPSAAVNAVVSKPSFASDCDVSAIVRDDGAADRPLVYEIMRGDLHMVPQRDIRGDGGKVR